MSENDEQRAVMQWNSMYQNRHLALGLLFGTKNAGKRSMAVASYYISEGLTAGVPDLILPVPRKGKTGLAIEMKIKPNKPTREQKWWLASLAAEGWLTAVCYSAEDAIRILREYLDIPEFEVLT